MIWLLLSSYNFYSKLRNCNLPPGGLLPQVWGAILLSWWLLGAMLPGYEVCYSGVALLSSVLDYNCQSLNLSLSWAPFGWSCLYMSLVHINKVQPMCQILGAWQCCLLNIFRMFLQLMYLGRCCALTVCGTWTTLCERPAGQAQEEKHDWYIWPQLMNSQPC